MRGCYDLVKPGRVPGIHVFIFGNEKVARMAGTSPAMTAKTHRHHLRAHTCSYLICAMEKRFVRKLAAFAFIGLLALPLLARADGRLDSAIGQAQAVTAAHGMVVAQEAMAARIGADILQKGGNAVDAAVAVGFALAVTYPRAGNIGGGGFMVIHRAGAANGGDTTIDYRETAPAAINEKSFLDAQGNADPQKSRDSALAIGVPGTVAGLALAEEKYGSGRFTLADLMQPAIALARDGFPVADDTADSLPRDRPRLLRWPSSAQIFLKADGAPLAPGDRLLQPDLANTLEAIAKDGPRAFYQGPIAQKLAAAVQAAGGVMTVDDLKDYRAIERRRSAAPIAATTSSRWRRRHRAASRSSRCSTSSRATTWRTKPRRRRCS